MDIFLQDTWLKVLEIFKNSDLVDRVIYETYFEGSTLFSLVDDIATIVVDNVIKVKVITSHLDYLSDILSDITKSKISCQIVYKGDVEGVFGKDGEGQVDVSSAFAQTSILSINPEYTFDNFIVGQSNAESQAAALAAAYNPGNFYNPLFIYGDSGLGKTHLLQAIGNYFAKRNDKLNVLLLSASEFVDGVYKSSKNLDAFKRSLCDIDVLLVDEIQFLAEREKSTEIFFHVFNDLVNKKKQIVLTSDRPPYEIKGLERRLVSRFSSGLTVTISPPEFDTAVQIIKSKIERQAIGLDIDDEVISYIASNYSSDVRKMEGVLNRLVFNLVNSDDNERITLPFAVSVLRDNPGNISDKELTLKTIKDAVKEFYGLSKGQLEGKNRTGNILRARHIAMYLARKHLDVTYAAIGDAFGNRDHTTVINACEKIEKLLRTDKNYKLAINKIEDLFISDN